MSLARSMDGHVAALTDTPEINDLLTSATGRLCFDIGANGGFLASVFADNFETVIAVEPHPVSYSHLEQFAPPNVRPLNVAVSDHEGEVELTILDRMDPRGYYATGTNLPEWGKAVRTEPVACTTLDLLAEQYGQPDFVKIDTEGHEWTIVRNTRVLDNCAFCIEIHSQEAGELILARYPDARIVRHEWHEPESFHWYNHLWIVREPDGNC